MGKRQLTSQQVDQLLMRADSLAARSEPDSAALLLNSAIRNSFVDTVLLIAAANYNQKRKTLEGRLQAARIYRQLIELEPDNSRYHFAFAQVLAQQKYASQAIRHFQHAIELDSLLEPAYLLLADLQVKPFLIWNYSDAAASTKKTLAALLRHLPQSFGGHLRLGELFAAQGKFAEAISHAETALQFQPTSDKALLLAGYLNFKIKEYQESEKLFARALQGLPAEKRSGYLNLEYLIPLRQRKTYRRLNKIEREKLVSDFWSGYDPDPTTEVNERRLEHYARVYQANLLFGKQSESKAGWQTKMGETLIRMGEPDSLVRMYPSNLPFTYIVAPLWFWYYQSSVYPCTLAFVDANLSGNYGFPFPRLDFTGSSRTNVSAMVAELIYYKQPEQTALFRHIPELDLQANCYTFKGNSQLTTAIVGLQLPLEQLDSIFVANKTNVPVELRFAVSDSNGLCLLRQTEQRVYRLTPATKINASGQALENVNQLSFSLSPGNYQLTVVAEAADSGGFGRWQHDLTVPNYNADTVTISDLVIAAAIDIEKIPAAIRRANQFMQLQLPASFHKQEIIHVYYEIYNLPLSIYSRGNYEVTYSLELVKAKRSRLKKLFGGGQKSRISHTYRKNTTERDLSETIELDISRLRAGRYLLGVEINDLIIGQKAKREVELEISD